MPCCSYAERPGSQIRGVVARVVCSFCDRPRPSMTLLDLTSCSQRVARPSLCPRQQQVWASLDHGPYGLFGDKRMGHTVAACRFPRGGGSTPRKKENQRRSAAQGKWLTDSLWTPPCRSSRTVLLRADAVKAYLLSGRGV